MYYLCTYINETFKNFQSQEIISTKTKNKIQNINFYNKFLSVDSDTDNIFF